MFLDGRFKRQARSGPPTSRMKSGSPQTESVERTGQADLEAFAGAFERRLLVDDNHDCAALEPLHHDKSSIHKFSRGVPPRSDNAMVQLYRLALTSRVHRGR